MKIIQFIPSPNVLPNHKQPVSMKRLVPDWYKNAERTYTDKHGEEFLGLKTCAPFLDGLVAGYALVTPVDIHVFKNEEGNVEFNWEDCGFDIIGERKGQSGETMPRPAGHELNHLVWVCQWGIKTPKNYSILVTHPLNRFDLPFTTMSAIVDSEVFLNWGNIPFFIKKDFTGVIPAGTPIAQLIPIKIDKWIYTQSWNKTKKGLEYGEMSRNGRGVYKRFWRKEKDYS